jgi:hypothetical protein
MPALPATELFLQFRSGRLPDKKISDDIIIQSGGKCA